MTPKPLRQRINSLFADIQQLATDADSASPRIREELDALTTRLQELEKQFAEMESRSDQEPASPIIQEPIESNVQPAAVAPILYEKEHVGYVFSENTLKTMQNARSFTQAQKQAERESMLNTISQKIQGATTVEAVLQIAARELGHALGAPLTIAQLGLKTQGNGS